MGGIAFQLGMSRLSLVSLLATYQSHYVSSRHHHLCLPRCRILLPLLHRQAIPQGRWRQREHRHHRSGVEDARNTAYETNDLRNELNDYLLAHSVRTVIRYLRPYFRQQFTSLYLVASSVYRTIELADGWNGTVITTQVYFSTSHAQPTFCTLRP